MKTHESGAVADLRVERPLALEQRSAQTGLSKAALENYKTDN